MLGKSSNSTTNPTVSFLGSHVDAVDRQEYTVSAASLGTAASNRSIVVAVGGARANAGVRTITSLTVGGTAATEIARSFQGNNDCLYFFIVEKASDTTGDIVATFSGGNNQMAAVGFAWWRVLDAGQPISIGTATGSSWSTLGTSTIGQTGDVALYALFDAAGVPAAGSNAPTGYSWSDATERAEHLNISSGPTDGSPGTHHNFVAADYTFTSAENHTETVTIGDGEGNETSYAAITLSNNNTFTANSMGANNVVVDTCSDNSSAEVTLSPCLDPDNKESNITLSLNNLKAENDAQSAWNSVLGTIGLSSGRYYWEITRNYSGHGYDTWGVVGDGKVASDLDRGSAGAITFDTASGKIRKFVETTSDADYYTSGTGSASGDVIGVDLDVDNDTIELIVGGTGRGTVSTSGLAKPLFPVSMIYSGGSVDHIYNFGSSSYTHTKPSGASNITETITGVGNFCTLNSLDFSQNAATISEGNLKIVGAGAHSTTKGTVFTDGVGKFVWECTVTEMDTNVSLALMRTTDASTGSNKPGATSNSGFGLFDNQGSSSLSRFDGSNMVTGMSGMADGDMYHLEFNNDTGDVYIWRKASGGTWTAENSGNSVTSGAGKTALAGAKVSPSVHVYQNSSATNPNIIKFNFGATSFDKTPSSNYVPLNTTNLAAPTVKNPDDGFALITLENGNTIEASLATARSGWGSFIDVFKREDTNNEDYDVRFSDDSGNSMHFNTNAAAGSEATLASGVNYSAWSWRVGATYGCYTAEISHDNSSATNQAHSLGSGAKSAVAKRSDSTGDWYVSHPNLSSANIRFNVQEATTSELVTVGDTNVTLSTSLPSGTYRVIVWKQIDGFSAFTGYDHNGSTSDGPYVHLGGSASLVAWRNIDSSNHNDFFSTFPSYTSNGNGNPTDVRYNWGNGEKGYSGITIGDVTANGYKMRPSSGSAFGKDADDPMLVWAWGLRPFGGSGVEQAKAR